MENIHIPENISSEVAERISSRFGMRLDSFIVMKNIENSIAARMNLLDSESPENYLKSIIRNPLRGDGELKALFDIISVNETFFFRTPEHFRALENHIIPKMLVEKNRAFVNSFSIWSAGCSTGEEPCTIAMVCREMEELRGLRLSILGSDQDGDAVMKASGAVFSRRSVQKTPSHLMDKYLIRRGSDFHLKDEIKSMVKFEKHNLTKKHPGDPFSRKWDIIFCRNVLIYLKKETIEILMKRFHECLNENGFLVLGPWETQHCPQSHFSSVIAEGIFLFEKKTPPHKKPEEKPSGNRNFERISSSGLETTIQAHGTLETGSENTSGDGLKSETHTHSAADAARHFASGNKHLETGDTGAAYRELLKAVELDPDMVPAYILLAVILRSGKELNKAEHYLKKALYLDALCVPALFLMGNIHLETGKIEKGILELEMVKKLLNRNIDIQFLETLGEVSRNTILKTCDHLTGTTTDKHNHKV